MSTEKKKASWSLNEDTGFGTYKGVDGTTHNFNWTLLFPNWDNFDKVEKFLADYGAKQALADNIAGIGKGATTAMKIDGMIERFDLLAGGETAKKRTPGDRVSLKAVKENYENLSAKEQIKADELMTKLGIPKF